MKKIIWGQKEIETALEKIAGETIFKEPSYVEVVDNRIYFYANVETEQVLKLNKEIRDLNNDLLVAAKIQEREPAFIFLHINSDGGSMFDGIAGMDTILKSQIPIVTIVDGCCASAATFLSVVGRKRCIHENSFMLIHQLSGGAWGKFKELQDENVNFIRLMMLIKSIYLKYTKIPIEKLDEILDHDLWFDAKTCLEYGLVDEIL